MKGFVRAEKADVFNITTNVNQQTEMDDEGNIRNIGRERTLPPTLPGNKKGKQIYGHLKVQMGALKFLTYRDENYLEDYGLGPKVNDFYAII